MNYRKKDKFWVTDKSDGFAWQFRVSELVDKELGEAYLNQVMQRPGLVPPC